jgi:hypothetical protein
LHFSEPNEDFLVSKAVKRASEAVQGSTKRQEGVRESRSDEFSSVGGNVASFMIARTNTSVERAPMTSVTGYLWIVIYKRISSTKAPLSPKPSNVARL